MSDHRLTSACTSTSTPIRNSSVRAYEYTLLTAKVTLAMIFNSSKFSLLQSSSKATTNGVSLSNPSKPTMLHYVVLIAALLGGTVSYFGLKNSVFKALNW